MRVFTWDLKAEIIGVRRRHLGRVLLRNPLRRLGAQLVRVVGKPQRYSAPLN